MRSPKTLRDDTRRHGWLLVLVLLVGCVARYSRVTVAGDSMRPTFEPGDRLLVRRGSEVARGDLVVVKAPGGLEVVKRVVGCEGDIVDLFDGPTLLTAGEVAVVGDHPAASTDSRRWGPLPVGAVHGHVVAIYHPPARARRL